MIPSRDDVHLARKLLKSLQKYFHELLREFPLDYYSKILSNEENILPQSNYVFQLPVLPHLKSTWNGFIASRENLHEILLKIAFLGRR